MISGILFTLINTNTLLLLFSMWFILTTLFATEMNDNAVWNGNFIKFLTKDSEATSRKFSISERVSWIEMNRNLYCSCNSNFNYHFLYSFPILRHEIVDLLGTNCKVFKTVIKYYFTRQIFCSFAVDLNAFWSAPWVLFFAFIILYNDCPLKVHTYIHELFNRFYTWKIIWGQMLRILVLLNGKWTWYSSS